MSFVILMWYIIFIDLHIRLNYHCILEINPIWSWTRASVMHALGCGATCRCLCSGRGQWQLHVWWWDPGLTVVALAAMEALAVRVCSCGHRVSPRACAWQWRLVTWFRVMGYRCLAGGCRRVMQVSDKLEIELINTLEYTLTFAKSPRTAAPPPQHTHKDLEVHVKSWPRACQWTTKGTSPPQQTQWRGSATGVQGDCLALLQLQKPEMAPWYKSSQLGLGVREGAERDSDWSLRTWKSVGWKWVKSAEGLWQLFC